MIPTYIDEVDAAWLERALVENHPGTQVSSAEPSGGRPGAASKLFFTMAYDEVGVGHGLPPSLVVKGGFTPRDPDEFTRAWTAMTQGLNLAEARFYRDFATQVDLEIPRCYFADLDEDAGRSVVVLEDLRLAGATFGAFDEPLTPDEAAGVLEQLAVLHSRWWADPFLDGGLLPDPLVEGAGLLHNFLTEQNWQDQLSRPRGAHVPAVLQDRQRVTDAVHAMWALQFEAPLCTLHGDPHIGNLYRRPGVGPGLLDWQVFCRGRWVTDVAYFLVGALDVETRRAHEQDLLRHYLTFLRGRGVDPGTWDEAWTGYRQRLFHGFLNFLTPADGIQSEAYNTVVGGRFATAILDLDAFAALGMTV